MIRPSRPLTSRCRYHLSSQAARALALLGSNNVRLQRAPPAAERRPCNHERNSNNNRSFCCSPAQQQQSLLATTTPATCSPIVATLIGHADSTNVPPIPRSTRRLFSTGHPSSSGRSNNSGTTTSGGEKRIEQLETDDAWYVVGEQAADWTPEWWNLSDDSVLFVKYLHDVAGIEYGWSIVCATVVMRVAVFPLMVYAQRTWSRVAHLLPEIDDAEEGFRKLDKPTMEDRARYRKSKKDLFAKHGVRPAVPLLSLCIQMPLFAGFFLGMKKMPDLFPDELAGGGLFWFPDLTAPDPLYILPVTSAVTSPALIELTNTNNRATMALLSNSRKKQRPASYNNKHGSADSSSRLSNNFYFRAAAVLIIILPAASYFFPSSVLCYWTTSNAVTMVQMVLLRQRSVRDYFCIREMPKKKPRSKQKRKRSVLKKKKSSRERRQ